MRKFILLLLGSVLFSFPALAQTGKVGINTIAPQAMLHVKDSNVLFSGTIVSNSFSPPASGAGIRMMWYPAKASFRVGRVESTQWDKDSIGTYSFAAGHNTKARGDGSTAFGGSTLASGNSSTAFGTFTIASGENSTAFGGSTIASGIYSTALGNGSQANGNFSTAFGQITQANGHYSVAMGGSSQANGNYSVAMGGVTIADSYASLVIGRFNDTISTSTNSWVSTDPVFIIGNGTFFDNRSNAFTVLKNAKTGINLSNSSPQALLHLKAPEASFDMHIRLENFSNSDYASIIYDGNMKFKTFGSNDTYEWRTFDNDTRMVLSQTGDLTIDGTLTQNSDVRLKKNIQPLRNSLQKILRLGGYHYNWIDKMHDAELQTGVMAQEIEAEMPELVKTDQDGIKRVNYSGMIPYLIEAIKELKKENEMLKVGNSQQQQIIDQQQKLLEELMQRIEKLEKANRPL